MIYSTLRHPEKGDGSQSRRLLVSHKPNGYGMEIGTMWKLGPDLTYTERMSKHGWNYAGYLTFLQKFVYADTVTDLRFMMLKTFRESMVGAVLP